MNKKEEIRILKKKLAILESSHSLSTAALKLYKDKCTQRGAKMQVMMNYMKGKDLFVPSSMQDWFNVDGIVK